MKAKAVGGCSWAIVLATLIPVGLGIACVALVIALSFDLPVEWEIPEGYQGWAALTVKNPACPPLSRRGLTVIIAVDQFGRACTSDGPLTKWRSTTYYYVATDGRRTRLPAHDRAYQGVQASRDGRAGSSSWPFEIEHIFIGTWAVAEQAPIRDLVP